MKKRMFVCFFIMFVFHFSISNVVFGQSAAQEVFEKYKELPQSLQDDIQPSIPTVLRAFDKPEIQAALRPRHIGSILSNPFSLKSYDSKIDPLFIGLLGTKGELRTFFADERFYTVLENPNQIDELARLIEGERIPTTLVIVSGDLQEGSPQTPLGNPLVVLVRDQDGDALSGVDVTFRVTRGGGSLSPTTARTNRIGRAETTLTLASEPGIHQVEASVVGFPSLTQTFTADATGGDDDGVPTTLKIVSGNKQSGEVGKPLAQPFVVGVLDQNGKPLQGTAVTFAVPAGNGRLSRTMATTDVYGQARTTLTLGSPRGSYFGNSTCCWYHTDANVYRNSKRGGSRVRATDVLDRGQYNLSSSYRWRKSNLQRATGWHFNRWSCC